MDDYNNFENVETMDNASFVNLKKLALLILVPFGVFFLIPLRKKASGEQTETLKDVKKKMIAFIPISIIAFAGIFLLFQTLLPMENRVDEYVNCDPVEIRVGESHTIKSSGISQMDSTLAFTIKDESIATISKKGVVTGKKKGETVAFVKLGEQEAEVQITVKSAQTHKKKDKKKK